MVRHRKESSIGFKPLSKTAEAEALATWESSMEETRKFIRQWREAEGNPKVVHHLRKKDRVKR